jgi:hypothetical protein
MVKTKRKTNDLQNTTHKTKDRTTDIDFFYNRDLIDTWAGGVLVPDGIIRLVVSVLGFDDGIFELMS